MPTNIAGGVAATPAPGTFLERAWTALMRAWSRHRNRIALFDLDDRLLRDLGFEIRRSKATAPLGWAVEARVFTRGPLFLGR